MKQLLMVEGLRVISCVSEGGVLECVGVVDPSHRFLTDHFPDNPTVPGFLQLEWILKLLSFNRYVAQTGFLIEQMKLLRRLRGSETIRIVLNKVAVDEERFECSILMDEQRVMVGVVRHL